MTPSNSGRDVRDLPDLVNIDRNRPTRELAALWARATVFHHVEHDLDWSRDRLMQVAEIPTSRFAAEGHRATAKAIDQCHHDGVPFKQALPPLERVPPAGDVLEAMRLVRNDLVIEFRVSGRVPLTHDIALTTFGGVSEIMLRAGHADTEASLSEELTEIIVKVQIANYATRALSTDLNDFDVIGASSEWLVARNALDHILNVLRLKGAQVVYSDYQSSDRSPFNAWIELEFGDRTIRREPSGLNSGWVAAFSPGPAIAAAPLRVSPDLFARTYEAAAREVALFSGSWIFATTERLRRFLLVLESTHSKPEHGIPDGMSELEAAFRERPFIERLERLRAAGPSHATITDDLTLASELANLRNVISHLQLRDVRAGKIEPRSSPYGIDPYDLDLATRVVHAMPVAHAIARQIVEELVPSQTLENVRARKPSFHELLRLRKRPGYIHNQTGSDLLAREALGRWINNGERDPEMLELVSEIMNDRNSHELAMSFVWVAIQFPEAHKPLFDAVVGNPRSFAEHAITVIRDRAPELLDRLKAEVPPERNALLVLLDAPIPRPGTDPSDDRR